MGLLLQCIVAVKPPSLPQSCSMAVNMGGQPDKQKKEKKIGRLEGSWDTGSGIERLGILEGKLEITSRKR